MDQTTRQSIIDRLNQATNVLVTVKSSPSVDELSACIGLTLFLNKQGKHATAVYSGDTPSTIEFLQPEETLEKNTDSLRDFIIALDKSKADKLRYKVEDKVVKIYITPYKTSLKQEDLDFSQGDFNVDVVLALGAHTKQDLDQAITAHGRILHDATIITMDNAQASNLGTLNLTNPQASSVSEMAVDIAEALQADQLDTQIATAFLTGIVAETARFSNQKTSPQTMTLSAKLMAAGANQQLIATKLQPEALAQPAKKPEASKEDIATDDGTLQIAHTEDTDAKSSTTQAPVSSTPTPDISLPEPASSAGLGDTLGADDAPSETGGIPPLAPISAPEEPSPAPAQDATPPAPSNMATSPPQMGGTLTASSQQNNYEPSVDPLSNAASNNGRTLSHGKPTVSNTPSPEDLQGSTLSDIEEQVNGYGKKTLSDIEQSVDSPHLAQNQAPATDNQSRPDLDAARQAVESAALDSPEQPSPLQAVGSQPVDLGNQPADQATPGAPPLNEQAQNQNASVPDFPADTNPAPTAQPSPNSQPVPQPQQQPPVVDSGSSPAAPPPVPPPMMPPA